MFERILTCVDGSQLSDTVAATAIELAALARAELVLFRAAQRYAASFYEGASPDDLALHDRIEQSRVAEAHESVDRIEKNARAAGLSVRAVTPVSDSIGESIIAAVRKHDCQLVVMASHGRRGMARLLMGSETEYVLTHSHVPVLVLR